jgi:LppX_LprAFG lipoprotein
MNRFLRHSSFGGADPRRLATVSLCAGAVALLAAVAGCGTSTTAGTSGSAKPQNARQAITLASDDMQRANSMDGTFSMRLGSGTATTGTIQMQRVPSLVFHENLSISAGGHTLPVTEIMSTNAIYLKEAALSGETGKPWLEIPFSGLDGNLGSTLARMFQSAQNGNPLEQAQMLAASKNVRAVGTQVIDGVQTTHYTGSFTPSGAVSALSPSLRSSVRPMLSMLSGDIRFNAWIDAQHQVRRVTEAETVSGEPVTVTINVTAINQPVHITVPPASQVTTVPKSGL